MNRGPDLTSTLRRAAQLAGGRVATVCGQRRTRWRETLGRVARLAGALRELGVGAGDRVAILAANSDRYLESYFAIWWLGAAVVPLNLRWSAPEIAYALRDAEPGCLLLDETGAALYAPLREDFAGAMAQVYCGDGTSPAGAWDYEALLASRAPIAASGAGGDDLAGIFYTGGTSGFAKGVMVSHAGLWTSAQAAAADIQGWDDYVYLHAPPMFHLGDGCMVIAATVLLGTHVMLTQFAPAPLLAVIERERVGHVALVPSMIARLLAEESLTQHDLSGLRLIGYGAAPMPEALLRRALQQWPGVQFQQGYGQTELSPMATTLTHADHRLDGPTSHRLRSAGRAMRHCEITVTGADGNALPVGAVGEVRIAGPNVMLGYWRQPELTAATLVDGWVRTGDAGYLDEDGYLYIVDRLNDMIITGGENVYSLEVENAVLSDERIAQCAVIGLPDADWGERVHAVVVPKAGAQVLPEQVIARCRSLIAGYKCPRSIEIRSAPLPLSAVGKVLKNTLRKTAMAVADEASRDAAR